MSNVATQESLAAMGDLVSKLVKKHGHKNKDVLDGDITMRRTRKIERKSKSELAEKRKLKRELLEKGRVTGSADVLAERKLNKTATKGIIQLFNAVKQHQKEIDNKLKKVKTESQKDKVHQKISTVSFLDLIKPKEKPVMDTDKEEDKRWNVLKEDFMMNNKLKDWKKDSEDEESDGDIEDNDSENDDSEIVSSDENSG